VIALRGRRALVTGGSRGIGAATALLLAEAGADVVVGYRSRSEDAAAVVERARGHGVRAAAMSSDIATPAGAEALAAFAERELGGLDLFVGSAGIWPVEEEPVERMGDERWARTMRENVDAMFFTTRAAVRRMADDGRVVLVASTAGQRGEAMHADYAASKGAMISFVKSMAIEVAPRGITVNAVAPGWVDTEMVAPVMTPGERARIERAIPIGRIAAPRDIAGPILFLCSPLARHVTGEILNVNGGSVLCG
jgi:3-oxoacyl-[acyl-carrier protein] reductase